MTDVTRYLIVLLQSLVLSAAMIILHSGIAQFSRREPGNWIRESAPLITGTLLYGLSFAIWLYILSSNKLSFAYPMAISSTLILSAIGARIFLSESISLLNMLGFLLIAVAAFLISK
jgi:drug/metabolite transporter (DMT)-like permease